MTGSNPMRAPESAAGRGPAGEMPDPWGVRRAENLLTTLEGVLSARVVTTPLGEVSEIHILASSGLSPKQVVRNVESALLAHLGLKVDHRKISVAQTADVRPIEALERGAVREQVLRLAPHWPVHRMLELAPKYWARTLARLDERHRAALILPWELESRVVRPEAAVSLDAA